MFGLTDKLKHHSKKKKQSIKDTENKIFKILPSKVTTSMRYRQKFPSKYGNILASVTQSW